MLPSPVAEEHGEHHGLVAKTLPRPTDKVDYRGQEATTKIGSQSLCHCHTTLEARTDEGRDITAYLCSDPIQRCHPDKGEAPNPTPHSASSLSASYKPAV